MRRGFRGKPPRFAVSQTAHGDNMETAAPTSGNALSRASIKINRVLFALAAVFSALMAVPTVLDVLYRWLFSRSIPGAAEMVEFSMVILVFGALGFLNDKRGHIRVDLIASRLPKSAQAGLELFSSLCGVVLIAIMTWCLLENGWSKYVNTEVSTMLGIPVYIFAYFAALGAATFALALLAQFVEVLGSMLREKRWVALVISLACGVIILCLAVVVKDSSLMDNLLALGSLGMALLLALILFGMPIGIGMALVGFMGMVILYPNMESAFAMFGITPYNTGSNYLYSVVPMFILMGELASYSGISRDLFNAAAVWLGRLPGGLAVASTSGCAGFAAVSGDSMATAVTMASVALPEMRRKKYEPGLACATLAAGGTLGILIPPSTGFIFYSLVTETSIGKLFLAGILPGLLLTLIFVAIIVVYAKRWPKLAPRGESTTMREKLLALKGVVVMLLLILLILGGILRGWFSPNEGGAVGAVATFIYAVARGRLSLRGFWAALVSTTKVTASLLLILVGVGVLGYFFAATGLPFDLADLVVNLEANRYVILAAVVVFYIVLGALMNVIPMILLTLPAIFPTIEGLGFDPIWFGVVIVILMEMGQITPPVGINVFALSSVAPDVPMAGIFKNIVPFFLGMLLLIVILVIIPGLATVLPTVLM